MDPLASPTHLIVQPDWARKPMPNEVSEFYPKAAAQARLTGQAAMTCHVTGDGSLNACVVVRETPQGAGFGTAALSMAPLFRMRPMTVDGMAVEGGTVMVPIKFVVPPEAQHPTSQALSIMMVLALATSSAALSASLYRWLRGGFGVAPRPPGAPGFANRRWRSEPASGAQR